MAKKTYKGTQARNRGRLTNQERDRKIADAKGLFIKGLSIQTIAEIIYITEDTIQKWRKLFDWDKEKELYSISPSEIKSLILENVKAIKEGKKMPYKADEISKLVSAFDKITDSRKKAVYTMESFDGFSNWIIEQAAIQKGKKRQELITITKEIRTLQDQYINTLMQ